MLDLHAQVLEFLKGLNRVVRSLRMYAATHPQVQKDIDACFGAVTAVLTGQEVLHLGVTEGMLIVDGKPIQDASASFKTFADLLRGKHIGSFKFTRGLTREEFLELVRLLCMKPEDALEQEHVKPELLAKFRNVKISELRFVGVEGDQGVGTGGGPALAEGVREVAEVLAESGTRTREDALKLLETLYAQTAEAPPGAPGETAGQVVGFLGSLKENLAVLDPAEAGATIRHYFEAILLERAGGMGIEDLRRTVGDIAAGLPPDQQHLLFGEAFAAGAPIDALRLLRSFDGRLRASPVVRELMDGKVDPEHLRRAMDLIAPAPAEFVKLYESVSAQLQESKLDPQEASAALGRLFKTLKLKGEEAPPAQCEGTVLVLDPPEIDSGGYPMDLEEMGFTVIRYMDGRKAWEHVSARGDVHCLVMDVKVPGMSGLEILNRLTEARRDLPVVLVTAHAKFADAFEVASYPRLRYLAKPVDLEDLRKALCEFIPQKPPEQSEEKGDPEELARARAIQEKLIPTEAPQIAGYDLAFYYKPALAVGGDYVDFVPLDENRTGMIVADVSGKNITGAMVMVMVRTVFRMIALRCSDAVATVLELNEHVARDIRRGMFVSAVYAILDRSRHSIEVANCGHNPALVWTSDFGLAQFLPISGTAIGLFGGATFKRSIRKETVRFEPGDRMLLYTDGVVEAMDAREQEFSEKQLLKLLNANASKSSTDLVQGLVAAIERHRGTAPQSDDITVLSLARPAEA